MCCAEQSNYGLRFERGKKKEKIVRVFFLWKVKMLLYSGAILPGSKVGCPGELKSQMSVSQLKLVRKRGQLAVPFDICLICGVAIGF